MTSRQAGQSVAVAVLVWAVAFLANGAAPERLFHLDFDGQPPFAAKAARGDPNPAVVRDVALVEGLLGSGAFFAGEAVLAYGAPGNLDKSKGSLAFWFKAAFDESDQPFFPCFFKEDAPLGPLPVNNIWLFMQGQGGQAGSGRLRLDMRVSPKDPLFAPVPGGLFKNVWRQATINWDCSSGTEIFIDGRRMPPFVSDKPFGEINFTWTPRQHARFFVGSRGRDVHHTKEPLWGPCRCVIDEFVIYDRPLTDQEVMDQYLHAPGGPGPAPLVLARRAAVLESTRHRPVFDLKNPYAQPVKGDLEVVLERDDGSAVSLLARPLAMRGRGVKTVKAKRLSLARGAHRFVYSWNGKRTGVQEMTVLPPYAPAPEPSASQRVLIGRFDAPAMLRGRADYRESAPAGVKKLDEVSYVEAGGAKFSRIAFRFSVKRPGRPHLLKIFWPDDAERVFDVIVNSPTWPCTYDVQGGVLCGAEYENTGEVWTYEVLYWPKETQQALILTTWVEGLPAAVCGFEAYELSGPLPPALDRRDAGPDGRLLGLYWEDPMVSQCFGGRPHERAPLRFSSETVDRMVAYMRWTGMNALIYPVFFYQGPGFITLAEHLVAGAGAERHPHNCVDLVLTRFEEAGDLRFIPSVNMCLSSNMLAPIGKQKESPGSGYLAVDKEGAVRAGVYPRINVLHPLYQDSMAALFEEFLTRFGRSPALKGIQLHLVYESPFWFGGLEWGYDDYTAGRFREETGAALPTFAGDDRHRRRHEWLTGAAREQWLEWRCEKLTEFYERLAGLLARTRKDLELLVGLRYIAEGSSYLPRWEAAGRRMSVVYRHAGIDFGKLARIRNIRVQKYFFPSDMKLLKTHRTGSGIYAGLELRRSQELQHTLTLGGRSPVGTNIYVNYFESAIGKRAPIPDFWWQCPGWRVAGPTPGGRSFLEMFAESVALYDAPLITTGGFVVGTTGHNELVREFARAYRTLPAVKFTTVPGGSDVAVARWCKEGFVYAVNRAPFPVEVTVTSRKRMSLTDLSGSQTYSGERVAISLKPFQLRSFRGRFSGRTLVISDCAVPPQREQAVREAIRTVRAAGERGEAVAIRLEHELAERNYVKCKHILEEVQTLALLAAARAR